MTTRPVGIALDIGTTTLVGSSVEIGAAGPVGVVDTVSAPNPQSAWGADLISRVNAAVADPAAVDEMRASVIGACNDIIRELSGPGRPAVVEVAAAGNSVMEHLFLGLSPEPFSRVPYRPAFREAQTVGAGKLGLEAEPGCPVYLFPLIGGFVGGDTVAVMLSLGIHGGEGGRGGGGGVELAIDIGTNSEIVLRSGLAVYATSAAAGPAFEGGELSCGMTAARGAISGVRVTADGLELDVVGGVAPRGICGSGLIDAAAGLLRAGVIERSGRIKGPDEVSTNLSVKI
ncbi:MAG: ASKHA domain-containing protein, partial [Thermodesulfobacteriota bacterium]